MFSIFKPKPLGSTRFSDFIRNASAAEKKRVYTEVLRKASERQNAVLAISSGKSELSAAIGDGLANGPGKPADAVFDRLEAKYPNLMGKPSA